MANHDNHDFSSCPYGAAQKVLAGKWSIIILHLIQEAPVRFNTLHRQISGISQATLAKQLRQLEEDGLIERKVYAQVPPKVEYQLSELGKEFIVVLDAIHLFGQKYIEFTQQNKRTSK